MGKPQYAHATTQEEGEYQLDLRNFTFMGLPERAQNKTTPPRMGKPQLKSATERRNPGFQVSKFGCEGKGKRKKKILSTMAEALRK
ncbi:unnamed protein product [Chondrus crispus]|uniref:Uncharacterized protein n=1 Tax=Chondrus crispus TaxID=2769 RepID=R7QHE2_CHOCR|nr:unnamed protein product [Chondrus crispus]CDF37178.1 unnamed protein product [Chondrus crispus]|eukprot:XP_005716997.1 unnamed protein product [Chondrus crispus]